MENLSELLEGQWLIKGTTFPLWLSQKRKFPTIKYEHLSNDPLTFLDVVSYKNNKGKTKKIVGIDTWTDNKFVWRGKGLLKILSSKWSILAISDTILVIKFERSFLTPAGIDVLVRDNSEKEDLKQLVLSSFQDYSLTSSEANRLVWL